MKSYELNVCGQICPGPVIEADQIFALMNTGDKLVIITDHEIVGYNLADWAEGKNLVPELKEIEHGVWQMIVIK